MARRAAGALPLRDGAGRRDGQAHDGRHRHSDLTGGTSGRRVAHGGNATPQRAQAASEAVQ